MSWMIVSDTSCEIFELENPAPDTHFATVPFKIRVGEREFVDNHALNIPAMMDVIDNYRGGATTACPSPEEWAEKFEQADRSIALCISKNLSGSYNSACAAREMVLEAHPEKQIYILDCLSCGGELARVIWHINEKIAAGYDFEQVCRAGEEYAEKTHLLFALASFENLAKAGRVSRVVGFVADRLNMRVLGRASENGTIDFFFKTRGETRILARILEEIVQSGYDGQEPVVITHNNNAHAADLLRHGILAKWPHARVHIGPCSGLCAFYEQDQGFILAY